MRAHQVVGGLPAVVECYAKTRDILKCQLLLDDLLRTIRDDFAKYAAQTPVLKLIDVFSSVAFQAGGKFKITRAAQDTSIISYKHALDLLVLAGVVYKIHHTSAQGIPLAAQIDEKKYKAILFDSGIHQRVLGLDLAVHSMKDDVHLINDGSIAEVYAGIELIAGASRRSESHLFYWHRESRARNAEVDYVCAYGEVIVPIEVKALVRGGMKSLHVFLSERETAQGIRLSQENFGMFDRISVILLYAAGELQSNSDRYLSAATC
jgi:predicted AAA+ superfamily ATPase